MTQSIEEMNQLLAERVRPAIIEKLYKQSQAKLDTISKLLDDLSVDIRHVLDDDTIFFTEVEDTIHKIRANVLEDIKHIVEGADK